MAQQPTPQPERSFLTAPLPLPPEAPPANQAAAGGISPPPDLDLAFCLELEPGREWEAPLCAGASAEANWTELLRGWLNALAGELPAPLRAPSYSLGLHLVDDASIASLNSTWRHHEGATDVLAFPAQEEAPPLPVWSGPDAPAQPLELGDIVISLETAARQAAEAGHPPRQELLFLASHGLLHLLGWDHPDEVSLAAMLARQEDLLSSTAHLAQVSPDSCGGESPS